MIMIVYYVFVFFFKQKTAYEMRISDWSSDVCSSDLPLCVAPISFIASNSTPTYSRPGTPSPMSGWRSRTAAMPSPVSGSSHCDTSTRRYVEGLSSSERVNSSHRSEERRVGKACVSTVSTRGSPYLLNTNKHRYK